MLGSVSTMSIHPSISTIDNREWEWLFECQLHAVFQITSNAKQIVKWEAFLTKTSFFTPFFNMHTVLGFTQIRHLYTQYASKEFCYVIFVRFWWCFGRVAQLVEQVTFNHWVAGSILRLTGARDLSATLPRTPLQKCLWFGKAPIPTIWFGHKMKILDLKIYFCNHRKIKNFYNPTLTNMAKGQQIYF